MDPWSAWWTLLRLGFLFRLLYFPSHCGIRNTTAITHLSLRAHVHVHLYVRLRKCMLCLRVRDVLLKLPSLLRALFPPIISAKLPRSFAQTTKSKNNHNHMYHIERDIHSHLPPRHPRASCGASVSSFTSLHVWLCWFTNLCEARAQCVRACACAHARAGACCLCMIIISP